jgi:hypothetical protein
LSHIIEVITVITKGDFLSGLDRTKGSDYEAQFTSRWIHTAQKFHQGMKRRKDRKNLRVGVTIVVQHSKWAE